MLPQKGGWGPGLVTKWLQQSSGWVWDGEAAPQPRMGRSRGVVLGAANTSQRCGELGPFCLQSARCQWQDWGCALSMLGELSIPIHGDVSKPPPSLFLTFPHHPWPTSLSFSPNCTKRSHL